MASRRDRYAARPMSPPSSQPESASKPHNPRMSLGGKLAFRGRVQDQTDDPGDRLLIGGDDPPSLRDLVPDGFDDVEIEIGPGKGAFVVAATEATMVALVAMVGGRAARRQVESLEAASSMAVKAMVKSVTIIITATTAARGHCWPDFVVSIIRIGSVGGFDPPR